ncbi:MAG: DEAD/DEAH box helicase [Planctomycetota bacterium]
MSSTCVHANWSGGRLHLWCEAIGGPNAGGAGLHPHTLPPEGATNTIARLAGEPVQGEPGSITLLLPTHDGEPLLSPRLAHLSGGAGYLPSEGSVMLAEWRVGTWSVLDTRAEGALELIDRGLSEQDVIEGPSHDLIAGAGLVFFVQAARFARSLVAEQRFVPAMLQRAGEPLRALWQPWLSDDATEERLSMLLGAMPTVARAVVDECEHDGVQVLQDFLLASVDAACRRTLRDQVMGDAIDGRDPMSDPHVSWLTGLLDGQSQVTARGTDVPELVKRVRRWVGGLEDRGVSSEWQLMLHVNEPLAVGDLGDLQAPGEDVKWSISVHLRSKERDGLIIDAEDIWAMGGQTLTVEGLRLEDPGELILAELGRAARVYPVLERMLTTHEPISLELSTNKAYEFLREYRPLLSEQGFWISAPEWWETPSARLGARLIIDPLEAAEGEVDEAGASVASLGDAKLGLSALVSYQWRIAVGDTSLTLKEFEQLAKQKSPLVMINNRWVEIRPQDVKAAMSFIGENPGGEMRVGEALRLAFASGLDETGVPVLGVDASGWLAGLLERAEGEGKMPLIAEPEGFFATLRPYQRKGLSWLAFLDRLGLGPCLADDMGLGKTIQLLALLVHERRIAEAGGEAVGPTLIVVPMSIVDNWKRESEKFAPKLRILVHHGVDRLDGVDFTSAVASSDVVITTYSLAHRDRELLSSVMWHRVVLDEAQNVKNPQAKQSQAVRALQAPRRIVLTGTPLENRLSELWSVMDFCNPGLLGGPSEFRRVFGVPIERYHDARRSEQLRNLVRPFILRRLKTDPAVISDLPEKVETKEFCRLSTEQAELYENTVKGMLQEVERAEGIRRRGIVLTTLIRLKQICNHPAQMLKDEELAQAGKGGVVQASRSGKCLRLLELLDEVMASGAQALIFTQFRQMGELLCAMLRQELDREVLFLHGGTPQRARQEMIDRFQRGDGKAPLFVLSLKAGGVGLNLTAASHVFHFDRWWNPAVENQATDRAFRIGQTKTVNVHKFIVSGTLEDRIDQMIESKVALAEDIIGSGEAWLTELDVSQLRDVLTLRPEAVALA